MASPCGIQPPEFRKLLCGTPFGTIRFPAKLQIPPGNPKENKAMADETQSSSGFSWFIAGLGIGALIGVLYAPKAGKETREDLAQSAREGTEYLRNRSREATEQINQIVD